jgi:dTDP-4-dehydrorhamnose reductase
VKILLTGAGGQLGRAVGHVASHGIDLVALDRAALDITDAGAVAAGLSHHRPDAVFNAAGFTDVDGAENRFAEALAVNRDGVRNLAESAGGARILHISTDHVFPGTGTRPYAESDTPDPVNAYGRSKLAGEAALAASSASWAVIRAAWVFSPFGRNAVTRLLRAGAAKDEMSMVADQTGSPTPALHLARRLFDMAGTAEGIYHAPGAPLVSRFDFAAEIFAAAARHGWPHRPRLKPCASADFPTPARRPAFAGLAETRGAGPFDWREGLDETLFLLAKSGAW